MSGNEFGTYCGIGQRKVMLRFYEWGDTTTVKNDNFECPYRIKSDLQKVFCRAEGGDKCGVFDELIEIIGNKKNDPSLKRRPQS